MLSKKRRHKRYSLQKCFNYVVSKINAGSADTDLLLQHKSIKKELEGFLKWRGTQIRLRARELEGEKPSKHSSESAQS